MTLPSPHFVAAQVPAQLHVAVHSNNKIDQKLRFVAYCKFCREGFPNDNELFQHRKAHEKCPYDDCKFNASGKVVAEHITRVHLKSNSLTKIQDLTTPEQIEKWREERRKRYPTSSNVALRQQAQEVRFQRGEKLQDRNERFGDFKQRNHVRNFDNRQRNQLVRDDKRNQNSQPKRNNKKDHRTQQKKVNELDKAKDDQTQKLEPSIGDEGKIIAEKPKSLRAFKAPKIPIDDESSDDEMKTTPRFKGTSQMKEYHNVETIVKEKAALSILGMYGSDSEYTEEEISQPQVTEVKLKPAEQSVKDLEPEDSFEKEPIKDIEGDAPDEVPIDHQTDLPTEATTSLTTEKFPRKRKHESVKRNEIKTKRTTLDYGKLKPSVNPFLEKLLQHDIRHERNVLLQCVNYVVKNNFFDVCQQGDSRENKEQK